MPGLRVTGAMATSVVLLCALAGCGDAAGEESTPEATATATGPTAARSDPATADTFVLDPAMAVDPPGPLRESQLPADLLVFSQDALSPATVRRIGRIKGVEAVESMSLAQVTIENRAINIAAVDPATYRRFTPRASAELQEAWERVAGGELAIDPAIGRRVSDQRDYVQMGVSTDAAEIHVGAFAEQIPQVDAVVNRKWGEALGMTSGNALLISTGLASPQSVRPAVTEAAGAKASVQILGPDLDTSVQQTAFLTGGSVAAVVGTFNYSVLDAGRIAPQQSWVDAHIGTEAVPILGQMTCNRAMFPQLRAALTEIQAAGLADEVHPGEYAGCYYPRFIAGSTTLSNHSFGLAFDLNVPGNQRGTVGEIDRGVVAIFERWGFAWGGRWGYTDPMHFEMNRIVTPR